MHTQSAGNIPETKTRANSHDVSQMQPENNGAVQLYDTSNNALQALANGSSQVRQLRAYQEMANQYASKQSAIKNNEERSGTPLVQGQENHLPVDGAEPAQLKRRNKRANWNQKQINQNERLFRRRAERQERYRVAREREEAARIPAAPSSTSGSGDGYRQVWNVNDIEVVFSSGHGYRVNHHKSGQPPSLNIRDLGTMDEIEQAILRHLFRPGGMPAEGESGERRITVSGQAVEYRFSRISEIKIGVGTYYRPD